MGAEHVSVNSRLDFSQQEAHLLHVSNQSPTTTSSCQDPALIRNIWDLMGGLFVLFFLPSVFESMLVSSKISHNWTVGFLKRRISPVSLCGMRMNLMTCLKKNHLGKKKVFFCCYFLFLYDVLDFHVHVVRFLFWFFCIPI